MIALVIIVCIALFAYSYFTYNMNKHLSMQDDARLAEIASYKKSIQDLRKQISERSEFAREKVAEAEKIKTLYEKQTALYNRALDKLQKYDRVRDSTGKFTKQNKPNKVKPIYQYHEKP